ncbi:MAG: Flp pilus assembly protein CpaB [Caulobacterales bacterium]|uniref:Flp pilus assembly protein CpaB n=1 Tax=Glycocaulis sp. TaxID=1969725 RepID=UPI003F9ECDDB
MNATRLVILIAAGLAAILAAFFVRNAMQPRVIERTVTEAPVQAPSVRVLAARRDLAMGQRVSPGDLYWQPWPEEAISPAYIRESADGEAINRLAGSVVRAVIAQGEPITERRLVAPGASGFMAAVITPGMRAIAVPTSARAGAGGFILPNDRVDLIVTSQGENNAFFAQTLLENVRVLAIDQSISEDGSDAVVGSTATLEVTPQQARIAAQAIAGGTLTLSLRSLADASDAITDVEEPEASGQRVVRVFRYGREERVALSGGGGE